MRALNRSGPIIPTCCLPSRSWSEGSIQWAVHPVYLYSDLYDWIGFILRNVCCYYCYYCYYCYCWYCLPMQRLLFSWERAGPIGAPISADRWTFLEYCVFLWVLSNTVRLLILSSKETVVTLWRRASAKNRPLESSPTGGFLEYCVHCAVHTLGYFPAQTYFPIQTLLSYTILK